MTGQLVDSDQAVTRLPLLVKIGNSEAERPQSGLASADVVYESVTEGGITRYAAVFQSAVFQSHEVTNLGPVRSARLSDLQIAPEFNAVLAHVGASTPIMNKLRAGSLLDLDQFYFQQYYHRTKDRVAPYNVYTSTAALRMGARERGFSGGAQLAPYPFQAENPEQGSAAAIDFDFAKETHVRYPYDAAQRAYHQIEYGALTLDAATAQPVPITNLILQFSPVQATDIIEDANGTHSLEYNLLGSGKALIFHDGSEINATWRRPSLSDRTAFLDAVGLPAPLARGSVWIAIVKPDTAVSVRPS